MMTASGEGCRLIQKPAVFITRQEWPMSEDDSPAEGWAKMLEEKNRKTRKREI
jgi:hypothetical protein